TTAELALVYSPTSFAHLTTMTLGVTTKLPVIPNRASYAYHVRATGPGGAVADSGEQALDFGQPEVKAPLLPPPVLQSPAEPPRRPSSNRRPKARRSTGRRRSRRPARASSSTCSCTPLAPHRSASSRETPRPSCPIRPSSADRSRQGSTRGPSGATPASLSST